MSEVKRGAKNTGDTLHLNLKKKWFDMVYSGEKKEVYLDLSEYWTKRLCDLTPPQLEEMKRFETITFSNGYAKDRSQFEVLITDATIREGHEAWGAKKDVKYFVFELGFRFCNCLNPNIERPHLDDGAKDWCSCGGVVKASRK